MLNKIKLAIGAVVGIVTAILYTLLQKEKAERADEHAQIAEGARKTTVKATAAIIKGARKEQAIDYEKIDTVNRDHFNK